MDSYTIDQLSDEVFGHLCNIAIDKCNDKVEKRRAGCGGRAMRKRVLIKNFVSDLMRFQSDREICEEEMLDENSYDFSESYLSEEERNMHIDVVNDDPISKPTFWEDYSSLDENFNDPSLEDNYLGESLLTSHDGEKSSRPEELYDLFIQPSEATEGGKPEAGLPIPVEAYDSFAAYDLGTPSNFEELTYTPLSTVLDPLQPVRAEPSDKLFLSLGNNCYSEMKTFTTLGDTELDIMDLDAGKENHFCKKRKSNEIPSLSDAIICDQKRQKL